MDMEIFGMDILRYLLSQEMFKKTYIFPKWGHLE